MTGGGRCQRRRKMTCVAADGEVRPSPISRVPAKIPAKQPADKPVPVSLDLYTQARKALSQRSPFDEAGQGPSVLTLPSGLAGLLSKQSDSRKRHKKSHSGAEAKSSGADRAKNARAASFWAGTEDYFRELVVDDIDKLYEGSTLGFLARSKCLCIPFLANAVQEKICNGDRSADVVTENGLGVRKEAKEEVPQLMEIDGAGGNDLPNEDEGCPSPVGTATGIEWLLGSRSKIYLTSERPSKKRKLLGGDAGLDKLLVACPADGSFSLCHYCNMGDMGDQLNRLIVCSSCSVTVHQRCYGVQDDTGGQWLCSLCKQKNESHSIDRPCLLCPRKGGALKPVRKRGSERDGGLPMEFVHLFCCQWIPEVYIEDTRTMEPVVNVEGIKETRRKLVCHLCKVKCGAGVRCSNVISSANILLLIKEITNENLPKVELRAFCSKHSEVLNNGCTQQVGDLSISVGSDTCSTIHQPQSVVSKPHKLKVDRREGDKAAVCSETAAMELDKLGDSILCDDGLSDNRSNSNVQSECADGAHQPTDAIDKNGGENDNTSDTLKFTLMLKKLIDRGKVNMKDVASEIGVSPTSLASKLDDRLAPDLLCKIVKWLRSHALIGSSQKNLKLKLKSATLSKAEMRVTDGTDVASASESDIPDDVPVKSVPPRRRTKSSIKVLKDNKVISSSKETLGHEGTVMAEVLSGSDLIEYPDFPSKESSSDILLEPVVEDASAINSSKHEVMCSLSEVCQAKVVAISEQNAMSNYDLADSVCSVNISHLPDLIREESLSNSYVHPLVHKKLMQLQNGFLSRIRNCEYDGPRNKEVSPSKALSSPGICCQNQNSSSSDLIKNFGVNVEQLVKARNMGVLDMSPVDEMEGELIFQQHRLLQNAVARKRFSDDLICKVANSLPKEIDAVGEQKWDGVLANQYLSELKEVRKQGRKERRHKEAQAVLAAATAAAAASSRISSFRKDTLDEHAPPEVNLLKVNPSSGRTGLYVQSIPRAKDTLSRLAMARASSERHFDNVQSTSDLSKEHFRTCDICRRSDTVAVHLDCYRSAKDSTGPWCCELCDELASSRSSGSTAANSGEKPYFVAECGLCGGTAGAFRKSTDGQWVHAFCAEWVLDSTFRRGQANPVEGMCYYGHCQSTFHPSCARSAGFYMIAKAAGGKLQHKAYCEKHSSIERAKAETHKHGIEELKSLKQVRVELERLRLLCERIIKREKFKRELVLCSHDILASNRDSVTLSSLARSSYFPPDVSSESATTSLKGYTDDYKSGSEAHQRSDDITVDSTIAGKRRVKFPVSVDNDQKTDDSSTSQQPFEQKPKERTSFSGKQIPHRPAHRPSSIASESTSDDGEKRSKYRKTINIQWFGPTVTRTNNCQDESCTFEKIDKGFAIPERTENFSNSKMYNLKFKPRTMLLSSLTPTLDGQL
ncbi:hypothetical protein RJ640_009230 [Escallonia rubra]|uniref:PHD finger family protein n=1 Tax=Escallonia rubra TaxID=112253 RepID=A0AA88QZP5_9ASTE|nr:hypothetical protein RJ640_009230 [Escallonia rubra]